MDNSNSSISSNSFLQQPKWQPWVYILIGSLSVIVLGLLIWGGYKIFAQRGIEEQEEFIKEESPVEIIDNEEVSPNNAGIKKTSEVNIFLVAMGDKGISGKYIGCGDSIIGAQRTITPTEAPLRAALNELLSFKKQYLGESGLYNALYQSNLVLDNVSIVDGRATISLSGTIISGSSCDDPRIDAQIQETAKQFSSVKEVRILLNGSEENYNKAIFGGKNQENKNLKIYRGSNFEFKYPNNFSISMSDHPDYPQGSFLKSHMATGSSVPVDFTVIFNPNLYSGTNFTGAWMAVANDSVIANNNDCQDFERNKNVQKLSSVETVNSIKWFKGVSGGSSAGTQFENRIYHTLHNDICYEVTLNLATSATGKQINKNDVWEQLNSIFSTFSFMN